VVDGVNGSTTLKAGDTVEKKAYDAFKALKAANIPVVNGGRSSGLMHNKIVIIDRKVLFIGSWNLSYNDTFRNNNNLLRITNLTLIGNYQAKFDEMFVTRKFGTRSKVGAGTTDLKIGTIRVQNYFSPRDKVKDKLVALVNDAKKSVHFYAFTYTHQDLAAAMIARARAGVDVQGVIEDRGASQGALPELYCAQIKANTDGNKYTMHHKVIIIDSEIVITGSFNFTQSADKSNDDNVLVIYSKAVGKIYEDEFKRILQASHTPDSITCP
jgi:phosphatidylserine/phosphatidylglycerophosphate/cardiolipin synthase-like enzyme